MIASELEITLFLLVVFEGMERLTFIFPPQVPALANFSMQRVVSDVLDEQKVRYHLGITHTTNRRFWEFNEEFKQHIQTTRPHVIEMECATLFVASYKHKVPLGALLLISDLPLKLDGIKTKQSAEQVFTSFTQDHVEKGVTILKRYEKWRQEHERLHEAPALDPVKPLPESASSQPESSKKKTRLPSKKSKA